MFPIYSTVYSDLVLFMNPFVSHIFCLIFLQIPSVHVCKIPQQTCYSQSVRIYVFTKLEFVYDYSFLWFFCKSTLEGGQKTFELKLSTFCIFRKSDFSIKLEVLTTGEKSWIKTSIFPILSMPDMKWVHSMILN